VREAALEIALASSGKTFANAVTRSHATGPSGLSQRQRMLRAWRKSSSISPDMATAIWRRTCQQRLHQQRTSYEVMWLAMINIGSCASIG